MERCRQIPYGIAGCAEQSANGQTSNMLGRFPDSSRACRISRQVVPK
jgi:hypothetical protein